MGRADARRGRLGSRTRAVWTQDVGRRGGKLFLGSTVPKQDPGSGRINSCQAVYGK